LADVQKDQITTTQLTALISSYLIAMGILTLPRNLTEKTGTPDGWISILIVDLLMIVAAYIIVKLCNRFPQKTFYQFSQELLGKAIGILFSMILIIYLLLLGGFEVRGMAEVTKLHLLPTTPLYATAIPFICVGIYLVVSGLNPTARVMEVLLPITTIIFVLVLSLSLSSFDINQIRPVLGAGIMPAIKGTQTTFLSITGLELVPLLFPFMRKPEQALTASLLGIGIPSFLYMITVILTIGNLGIAGVLSKTWPTISLFRRFELTGIIFERFESFFLAVWILQIFATYAITHLLASYGLAQLISKKYQPIVYGLAPIIYLIAMSPRNINDLFHLGTFVGYIGICFALVIPPILLFIAVIRRKKDVPQNS
jgi:spore germination protein